MGSVKDTSFILQIMSSKNGEMWPIGSYLFWDKGDDGEWDDLYPKGPGWRACRDPKEARKFMNKESAIKYWEDSKSKNLDLSIRVRKVEVITTITNVE